jgi:hypothetical protein
MTKTFDSIKSFSNWGFLSENLFLKQPNLMLYRLVRNGCKKAICRATDETTKILINRCNKSPYSGYKPYPILLNNGKHKKSLRIKSFQAFIPINFVPVLALRKKFLFKRPKNYKSKSKSRFDLVVQQKNNFLFVV